MQAWLDEAYGLYLAASEALKGVHHSNAEPLPVSGCLPASCPFKATGVHQTLALV